MLKACPSILMRGREMSPEPVSRVPGDEGGGSDDEGGSGDGGGGSDDEGGSGDGPPGLPCTHDAVEFRHWGSNHTHDRAHLLDRDGMVKCF